VISPESNAASCRLEAMSYYLESWKETEGYLRHGVIYDGPIHEDCSSAELAHLQVVQIRGALRRFKQEMDFICKYERLNNEQTDLARKFYLQGKDDGQDNLIQRVVANWNQLHELDSEAIKERLLELKIKIYYV
jgi:alkylhydroperoxidase family enzyme